MIKKAYYSKKSKLPVSLLVKKLWNNNYFNSVTKKWQCESASGFQRGFNQYILEQIYKTLKICLENNYNEIEKLSEKLEINIKFKTEEKENLIG